MNVTSNRAAVLYVLRMRTQTADPGRLGAERMTRIS